MKAAFCEWGKKKIKVIQRGKAQRKDEVKERAQGERRAEQWESMRRLERSSERQREAEKFGTVLEASGEEKVVDQVRREEEPLARTGGGEEFGKGGRCDGAIGGQ